MSGIRQKYVYPEGARDSSPLSEDGRAILLESYSAYLKEIKRLDYYMLRPEELYFFPLLDLSVLDLNRELRRGTISPEILYHLNKLEGDAIAVNSFERTGLELFDCRQLVVTYVNGEVRYQLDDEKGFAVPTHLIRYGPRYQDGFPTLTCRRNDSIISLAYGYQFDPDRDTYYGELTVSNFEID